jgi:hypothetical protein
MRTNVSRRQFLRVVPLSAAGVCAGAAGFRSLATSRSLPREAADQAGPPATRPFLMVALGDSIMWGQGLPESMKFRNIVAGWIQGQFHGSRSVDQLATHAHSGAVTGWGAYPPETGQQDPDTFFQSRLGYPFPGEFPFSYPSISFQIGMTVNDLNRQNINPALVDLVLLDGGINDISVKNILDVTLTEHGNGPNWVRTNTNARCIAHMRNLLPQVAQQFPNAAVILTGYFPIVSDSSDLNEVAKFLEIHFSQPGSYGDPVAYIDGVRAASLTLSFPVRAALADRSHAWAQTAFNGFSDLVSQANQGLVTPRVALAWPNFSNDNSYAASRTFLFTLGDFLSDEKRGARRQPPPGDWSTPQGIAYYRSQNCSQYDPMDSMCYEACIGHPNQLGAQAYADAVLRQIEGTLAPHLATRGLVENPACKSLRAQEGLLVGQITTAQSDLAELGKEQRDCEAGIGEPSHKPKQCGALENKVARDQLTRTIHEAGARLDVIRHQKGQAGCWF